jgi:hypothetical protein
MIAKSNRTPQQRARLFELALTFEQRSKPLGVGVHRECWAGVARTIARLHNDKIKSYFGLNSKEIIEDIMLNNVTHPEERNQVMTKRTLERAQQ